jgi:hypothetical protein
MQRRCNTDAMPLLYQEKVVTLQKNKAMSYNRLYKLEYYLKVVELTNKHYIPGYTTYSSIYRKHILPVYPMSYQQYINILGMRNLRKQYEEELQKRKGN